MQRDIQFALADFVSKQGYTGTVTVIVPRSLAQRLIDGYPFLNSDIQQPEDVRHFEPVQHGLLEVLFELGSVFDDQINIRTAEGATFFVNLPPLHHVGIWQG